MRKFYIFLFFFDVFSKQGQICLHANSLQEVESFKNLIGFAILTTWVPKNYFWQNLSAIFHALVVQI